MKGRTTARCITGLAVIALALLASGCGPTPPQPSSGVTLPESPPATIEADLDDLIDLRPVDATHVEVVDVAPDTDSGEGCAKFTLPDHVLFAYGDWSLSGRAPSTLKGIANTVLMDYPGAHLLIDGHTDAKGTPEDNAILSQRRADEVARWLTTEGGLALDRISTTGHGSDEPIANETTPTGEDDPEARARNRRVEITVVCPG